MEAVPNSATSNPKRLTNRIFIIASDTPRRRLILFGISRVNEHPTENRAGGSAFEFELRVPLDDNAFVLIDTLPVKRFHGLRKGGRAAMLDSILHIARRRDLVLRSGKPAREDFPMSFFHSIVSFPMGWLVGAAIVTASLLVLWISTLLSRRWFVTIKKSEETELLAYHLGRIAYALERIASTREPNPQQSSDTNTDKGVSMSIFGR
jgi:hypothetical protein